MLPKNSKHYIVPTAEQLGQDQQLVEDIVCFYYSQVRKSLSNLAHHSILIENVGTFHVKTKQLIPTIKKYQNQLQKIPYNPDKKNLLRQDIINKIVKIKKVILMLEQEREKNKQKLKLRSHDKL